ncbi:MAG: SLATT domain-containing protein [Firmicutes bacterium]|nr:SLATT domain-containing protein [Bacillota bacterium]
MGDQENANQHLLEECQTVAENCLYTAQARFILADKANFWNRLLLIVPSCIAAIGGILTSLGLPGWIGAFAAISGVVTALAAALGVDQKAMLNKQAANLMTALRHEARALHETYWRELTHEQLVTEVRRINDRYNCLVQALETTDAKTFDEARRRIKTGIFEPDFQKNQKA